VSLSSFFSTTEVSSCIYVDCEYSSTFFYTIWVILLLWYAPHTPHRLNIICDDYISFVLRIRGWPCILPQMTEVLTMPMTIRNHRVAFSAESDLWFASGSSKVTLGDYSYIWKISMVHSRVEYCRVHTILPFRFTSQIESYLWAPLLVVKEAALDQIYKLHQLKLIPLIGLLHTVISRITEAGNTSSSVEIGLKLQHYWCHHDGLPFLRWVFPL